MILIATHGSFAVAKRCAWLQCRRRFARCVVVRRLGHPVRIGRMIVQQRHCREADCVARSLLGRPFGVCFLGDVALDFVDQRVVAWLVEPALPKFFVQAILNCRRRAGILGKQLANAFANLAHTRFARAEPVECDVKGIG
jgi:hypothetical protein